MSLARFSRIVLFRSLLEIIRRHSLLIEECDQSLTFCEVITRALIRFERLDSAVGEPFSGRLYRYFTDGCNLSVIIEAFHLPLLLWQHWCHQCLLKKWNLAPLHGAGCGSHRLTIAADIQSTLRADLFDCRIVLRRRPTKMASVILCITASSANNESYIVADITGQQPFTPPQPVEAQTDPSDLVPANETACQGLPGVNERKRQVAAENASRRSMTEPGGLNSSWRRTRSPGIARPLPTRWEAGLLS